MVIRQKEFAVRINCASLSLFRVVVILLSVIASGAKSAPPASFSFSFDFTVQSNFWTNQCGVPVFFRDEGKFSAKLFNPGSTPTKEIDVSQGERKTYFSPLSEGGTGRTFTFTVAAPTKFVFPNGIAIGAEVTFYNDGLGGFYAPTIVNAGRSVGQGVVVELLDNGFPIVELLAIVSNHGRPIDVSAAVDARCAFLKGL
jgi:hypothetical protein